MAITKKAQKRKEEAQRLHATITEQIEQLRDSEKWEQFLDYAASFHRYSLNNLMLIRGQYPTATVVAGYRAWQKKGRQVRKGEKSIRIFGYRKQVITETDDDGEEKQRTIPLFPPVSVFDVSQTDPIEGMEQPGELTHDLEGSSPAGLMESTKAWLESEGWTVTIEPVVGEAIGLTEPASRSVVVQSGMSDAQTAATLLHEAAHVVLHADDIKASKEHLGVTETEAESVAYIVAKMAGLDTSDYSVGYIAGWAKVDVELVESTAARVLDAVSTLSEGLEATHETAGMTVAA